jgi:hypothetical protein
VDIHKLLSMKHFHEAWTGTVHECSLKLSIGKVRSVYGGGNCSI